MVSHDHSVVLFSIADERQHLASLSARWSRALGKVTGGYSG
jgi:hypothetical protein